MLPTDELTFDELLPLRMAAQYLNAVAENRQSRASLARPAYSDNRDGGDRGPVKSGLRILIPLGEEADSMPVSVEPTSEQFLPLSLASWVFFRVCLAGLFVTELIWFAFPIDTLRFADRSWEEQVLFTLLHGMRSALITAIAAVILFGWDTVADELRRAIVQRRNNRVPFRWLAAHVLLVVPLAIGSIFKKPADANSIPAIMVWITCWAVLSVGAGVTLGLAALPAAFWKKWFLWRRDDFVKAAGIGCGAYLFGYWSATLWTWLQRSTFEIAVLFIRLAGLGVQTDPVQHIIATPSFAIRVAPECSGIEGIALVSVFLGAYIWILRGELRFPHTLLLFPAGIFAIWLLNGFRIAVLVLIGNRAPDAAVRGFHSLAGWIFFNGVIFVLIALSRRLRFFQDPNTRMLGASDARGLHYSVLKSQPEARVFHSLK